MSHARGFEMVDGRRMNLISAAGRIEPVDHIPLPLERGEQDAVSKLVSQVDQTSSSFYTTYLEANARSQRVRGDGQSLESTPRTRYIKVFA
jgi:hypothetical protein